MIRICSKGSPSSTSARMLCWGALAALLVLGTGCASSEGSPTGSTCPPGSTLNYENFGKGFMRSYCNSCHAGREEPLLTSQPAVKANAAAIDQQAASGPSATNRYMPENAEVPEAERKKLGEWLACGAP